MNKQKLQQDIEEMKDRLASMESKLKEYDNLELTANGFHLNGKGVYVAPIPREIVNMKMTMLGIFWKLHHNFMYDYKGHFRDMYEGHNHAERMATRYAIKNTLETWRKQYV